ncbi:MAG: dihydrolipoyllysine-residue acetyltransferase, partial [Gammaproteobacteria bacterium]|nr:dihydrolipoyllysine-residue acetyltransferase [Gammaproteobacteria bacterium]
MAVTEIRVPDIGDFSDVEVIEVMIGAGDTLAAEDSMITLETDKAAMDVPAPQAGAVVEVLIKVGDRVSEGDLIARMEVSDSADDSAASDDQPVAEQPGAVQGDATVALLFVEVPDIGDFDKVDIIEIHVSAGDQVAAEDPLITLETDKAAMDVPSPYAGKVSEVLVSVGDKVSQGDRIIAIDAVDTAKPEKPAPAASAAPAGAKSASAPALTVPPPKAPAVNLPAIDEAGFAQAHAGPAMRKFARELGVDLGRVGGSGKKGRVTRDDITAFVKSVMSGAVSTGPALPEVPKVDFSKFGPIEVKKLSRIQKISGPRLHASWVNLPHVTQHDLADITDLEKQRKALKAKASEQGVKLTPLAYFVVACVRALQEFPAFNASLDAEGENLVLKQYFHIGFAADTPNGLVVPVIRDADQKDLLEVAAEVVELAGKAREGKLPGEAMRGGCFTISSLGGIGGTAFTPIINAPEVAILGISRSSMQPVWRDGEFVPRLMVPLSLSYDHLVIEAASAA